MIVNKFPLPKLEFIYTERCNLRCKYCFEPNKNYNSKLSEENIDYIFSNFPTEEYYPLGGENLIDLDIIESFIKKIESSTSIPEKIKLNLLRSVGGMTTNGTIKSDEIFKLLLKYNMKVQISLDGPKEVHDSNRVFPDGHGSFDTVMSFIDRCQEEGVRWGIHGALSRSNYHRFKDIYLLFLDISFKYFSKEKTISDFNQNILQLVFEENITDEDIDIFLNQFYILSQEILSEEFMLKYSLTKNEIGKLLKGIFDYSGTPCSAGVSMLCTDKNYNVTLCHRFALKDSAKSKSLGNLKTGLNQNFAYYNNIFYINSVNNTMFSKYLDKLPSNKKNISWHSWCPAANSEKDNSIFFQPTKYNTLVFELNNLINILEKKYRKYFVKIEDL